MKNIIDKISNIVKLSDESKDLYSDLTSNLHSFAYLARVILKDKPIYVINSKPVKCKMYDVQFTLIDNTHITFRLLKKHYSSNRPFDIVGAYFKYNDKFYYITNVEKRICQFDCPVLSITFDYFEKEKCDSLSLITKGHLIPDDFMKYNIIPSGTKIYDFWIPKEGHRQNILSLISLFNENEINSVRSRTEKKFPHHRVN